MKQLQKSMTSADFIELAAYNRIEPFGEDRADMRAATVAYWAFVATQGNEDHKEPIDFMPPVKYFTEEMNPKKKQSVDEMEAIFRMIARS